MNITKARYRYNHYKMYWMLIAPASISDKCEVCFPTNIKYFPVKFD